MFAGTLLGLASALAWSFANVTAQAAARRFGTFAALIGSQLVGAAAAIPVAILYDGAPGPLTPFVALMILVAGLAGCLAYGGLFDALRRGQVAVVSPIISAWSLISVALGAVLFEEAVTPTRTAGVVLVVTGNALLAYFGTAGKADGTHRTPRAAVIAAFLSALGFGVMTPAVAVVGEAIGRIWTIPAVWAVELAVGVPLVLRLGLVKDWPRSPRDWRLLVPPGLFETAGFVALMIGLSLAPLAIVTPASSLSTGLSVTWGILLLKERMPRPAFAGALLASAGVVAVNL